MLKNNRKFFLISSLIISLILSLSSINTYAFSLSGERVVKYAKQYLGYPYVWGANGPNSFDCSGLTSYSYKNALGIDIGRTTYTQITDGAAVSRENLQPGDLVFTSASHVGIYVGNDQIINSSQTGDVVKISSIYSFYAARRIVNSTSAEDITFESNFYSYKYDDLNNAFGTNEISLADHFLDFGIKEGRSASEAFDVSYYLANNADLLAAFGTDYTAAYNHFLDCGYRESRDLSPVFNMSYYLSNNPDVAAAYGTNYAGVIQHFLTYGLNEGRASSANFNLSIYKANNPDLVAAFGDNNKSYYDHYLKYGISEGRIAC